MSRIAKTTVAPPPPPLPRAKLESLESRTLLSAQWNSPSFGGNPYTTVSGISGTANSDLITESRTSGELPFFIQVSADQIMASGTDAFGNTGTLARPYEDLQYSWNFGDQDSFGNDRVEPITNPARGQTINANTDQTGPEAAYVYRNAGTYHITLTVTGKTSTGTMSQTFMDTVTANPFDYTNPTPTVVYYDTGPNGYDGTDPNGVVHDGSTPEKAKRSLPGVAFGIGETAMLARGSTFDRTTKILMNTHSRIDAYGSGADPVIHLTRPANTSDPVISITNGASSKDDIVISHVKLLASTLATDVAANSTTALYISGTNTAKTLTDIYFDNVTIQSDTSQTSSSAAGTNTVDYPGDSSNMFTEQRQGFWNTDILNNTASNTYGGTGIYGLGSKWGFVVGGSISGNGAGPNSTKNGNPRPGATYDHHVYPQIRTHALFRDIDFGTGLNRNYNINTNVQRISTDNQTVPFQAHYFFFADNSFSGTKRALDASEPSNNASLVRISDLVVQGNAFHGLRDASAAADNRGKILWYNMEQGTVRDNVAYDNSGEIFSLADNPVSTFSKPQIYSNQIYQPTGNTKSGIEVGGLTQKFIMRDNTVYSASSGSTVASGNLSTHSGSTVVDDNDWYVPGGATFRNTDSNSNVSFATWQGGGYDPHGTAPTTGTPGWLDPANGNFLTSAPTGPTAPSNLVGTAVSASQISLTWTDNSSDETGFEIWRKVGAGGTYSLFDTKPTDRTSYADITLSAGTQYFYKVRAKRTSGATTTYSAFTSEINATTQAAPASQTSVDFNGSSPSTTNVDDYWGTGGNGWNAGWSLAGGNNAHFSGDGIVNTAPLFSGTGNYLTAPIIADAAAGSAAVGRQYNTVTGGVNTGASHTIQFDIRPDNIGASTFSSTDDRLTVWGGSTNFNGTSSSNTWVLQAAGAARLGMTAKVWGFQNGAQDGVEGPFVSTGIAANQGDTYRVIINNNPTTHNYTASITNLRTRETYVSGTLGWRTSNSFTSTSPTWVNFGGRMSATGESVAFSLDSIRVHA